MQNLIRPISIEEVLGYNIYILYECGLKTLLVEQQDPYPGNVRQYRRICEAYFKKWSLLGF